MYTLTGPLPGEDDCTVDSHLGSQVHSPKRLVDVVVVHDGAIGQVGVQLAVDGQVGVSVSPLGPGVAFVIHPRFFSKSLVGNYIFIVQ